MNEAQNEVETSKLSLKSKWKGAWMSKGRDGDREVINIISSLCVSLFSLVSEFPEDTSNHSIETKLSCLKLKSVYFKYLLCGEAWPGPWCQTFISESGSMMSEFYFWIRTIFYNHPAVWRRHVGLIVLSKNKTKKKKTIFFKKNVC